MRAGTLRERVTIEAFISAQDAYGEPIEAWGSLASNPTVWASVGSRASGEPFISGAVQTMAEVSHTVRLRYRDDITPKMRLLWRGDRTLYVENVVDPDGRKADLILMCREEQV